MKKRILIVGVSALVLCVVAFFAFTEKSRGGY